MHAAKIVLATVVAGLLAGILAALIFIYSGIYNVAADNPHGRFEYWVLFTTRDQAVTRRSRDIEVPQDYTDEARILRGAGQYEEMCAICHLRPGLADTGLRRGLTPEAPDLTEWTDDPAKTFWIVKHGIRMTGMPAWGRSHDDDTLWDVVAFLQRLPGLSQAEYEEMVATGEGHRHSH